MIAHQLFGMWGTPTVDLFATRLNRKVEAFYSRLPDPLARPVDPLVADWSRELLYIYSPPPSPPHPPTPVAVVIRALRKIVREEAQVIAVIPWWPRLVPPGSPAPDRPAGVVARAQRSSHRGGRGRLPQSPHTPPSHWETLQRSLHRCGVSVHAADMICAPHRP